MADHGVRIGGLRAGCDGGQIVQRGEDVPVVEPLKGPIADQPLYVVLLQAELPEIAESQRFPSSAQQRAPHLIAQFLHHTDPPRSPPRPPHPLWTTSARPPAGRL